MSEGVESADDTLAATRGPAAGERASALDEMDQGLERGTALGRYVVLSKLGAGAMGVVYAGYDPELDRKVALKLLLPGRHGSEGHSRLLREAQALAKLQHPNVVTIHDVGTRDERVWMAMEFVAGETLGRWCVSRQRRWTEVLDVLVRAGRGVAAAHAAGLLHRDLKPDNVMVGVDGRVRVMDFGLARARELSKTDQDVGTQLEREAEGKAAKVEGLEVRLTSPGALMGTPAYMAPEQFLNAELGPATDQFGFCAMAWEALLGTRPFAGEGVIDLAVAVLEGKRAAVPRGTGVPGWLCRVLDRGLSVEPHGRWSSMEVLLEALERGQTRARWRRAGTGAVALGVVAAAVFGWRWLDEHRRIASCEAQGASIEDVWNDGSRERLRAALVGTGVSHAHTTAKKVMPWLDDHGEAWRSARTQACIEYEVHARWDADAYARAAWCLDDRRMELEALVEELSRGDTRAVERAVQASAGLGGLDSCQQRAALEHMPLPPTAAREEARALRAEHSKAIAMRSTGAYPEGLEIARAALERARAVGWPPLVAQTRLAVGELLASAGRYAEAEETLENAYFEAVQAGATQDAAAASTKLVFTVGVHLSRHADALRWSRHAEVVLASLPDLGRTRLAAHLTTLAMVHDSMGSADDAMQLYERALEIWEEALGQEHPDFVNTLNNLAISHYRRGAFEEAKDVHERALAIREEALGPEHPLVAATLHNLAVVHDVTGAYEEAKALYERALAIREDALGSKHPEVAQSLSGLAIVHHAMGALEEAKALHERALAIQENALGSEHPALAQSLNNLAMVHARRAAYDEAKALYERALTIQEKTLGPEHPDLASSMHNLANVHHQTGAYEEAKALYERALAITERAEGPEHPHLAQSLNNLAAVHHATGAHEEAKRLHERALAIKTKTLDPAHPSIASSLKNLADVHYATGAHEEAKQSYARALGIWESAMGPDHPNCAHGLVGLARVALAQRRPGDAVPLAERSVAVREAAEVPATDLAEARFVLAQAMWNADRERPRALVLAEQAHGVYREAGAIATEELAEVEVWLRARRRVR
jgi:eukaryotic-like serine/threonine-protein kinase